MAKVTAGRMTGRIEGDFVVFLIGMRINRPWKIHKWLPVARAMGPMLRVLSRRKDLGLLGFHVWISPTGPLVVQYWRSVEQLEAFARDTTLPHRPAWQAFYKSVGDNGDVGIWHETYVVKDGGYENVYGNMPRFGLARAGEYLPLAEVGRTATQRRAANGTKPDGAGADESDLLPTES